MQTLSQDIMLVKVQKLTSRAAWVHFELCRGRARDPIRISAPPSLLVLCVLCVVLPEFLPHHCVWPLWLWLRLRPALPLPVYAY